jgi:hypothetical protein
VADGTKVGGGFLVDGAVRAEVALPTCASGCSQTVSLAVVAARAEVAVTD